MSNPPNSFNSNTSFNRYKGSYFNDDVDVSGGDIINRTGNLYLADNSSIYTSNNQIQFNEEFQFCDFVNNVNVLGQLKNTYNAIEYDVGLQCEKTDTLVSDVATISPIVYDTQFKTTGFYWDSGLSTTVFNNNASFPNASISSTAINNTSFVSKSGSESIDGIKTFNSPPVMSGASITIGTIPVTRVNGTAVTQTTANQVISSSKQFSVVQNFTSNIRLDGSLLLNSGATTITNAQLQTIPTTATKTTKMSYMSVGGINTTTITDGLISQTFSFTNSINNISTTTFGYLSGVTSSIQAQINNFTGVSLSANNSFTGSNTFANITFSGTLNNISTTTYDFLSGATENLQTAINALKTKTDTTNINLANTTTSANEAKQRTTDIEFSDIGGNQTTISNKCVLSGEVVFQTDLNDITPTTFGYLANCNSNIQTQLDSKLTVIPGTIFQHIGGTLQEFFPYRYLLCNGQSVSRTEYAILYQWIGTSFGSDSATTFKVPDYRCCFLRMYSNTTRVVNGVNYTTNAPNTIQQDSLEAHVHSSGLSGNYLRSGSTSNTSDAYLLGTSRPNRSDFPEFGGGVSSSHRTSTETRPLNHSVYFYITC